jgi:hypothetical protein
MPKVTQEVWQKSSYSGGGNNSCVEVSWRKSSYSGTSDNSCVEVAFVADAVGVRDSKNTQGPTLAFSPAAWRGFVTRR